jgi:hypothetical protein
VLCVACCVLRVAGWTTLPEAQGSIDRALEWAEQDRGQERGQEFCDSRILIRSRLRTIKAKNMRKMGFGIRTAAKLVLKPQILAEASKPTFPKKPVAP